MTAEPRPRVIHLSADFPDPLVPRKTAAIQRLVDLTVDRFDHVVFSINRVPLAIEGAGAIVARHERFEYGYALAYRAPPLGLLHVGRLLRLGRWLAHAIRALDGPPPRLLVGHKLTVEGVAVAEAARLLGLPYALSVQGNTDGKILAARPDLRRTLRQVWQNASAAFPFTPWALEAVERHLGPAPAAPRLLPCALDDDTLLSPRPQGDGLVTVFNFDTWKTKNFDGLVAAQRIAAERGVSGPLSVVGGGSTAATRLCKTMAAKVPGVRFEGPAARALVGPRLNRATALVLPSRRETFGMVFIEALFAGCPVIYPAGCAIDGYFDGAPFALRVDARSPATIAAAMKEAVDREAALKGALLAWQRSPAAARFTRREIAGVFADGLSASLAPAQVRR